MSNETMTDARALEVVARSLSAAHKDAYDHIAARLRGEAAQGEQQAVAWIDLGQHGMIREAVLYGVTVKASSFDQIQGCVFLGGAKNRVDTRPQPVAVAGDESAAFDAWFRGEQGTEYNGMWSFARAAWMHRAALSGAAAAPVDRSDALDVADEDAALDDAPAPVAGDAVADAVRVIYDIAGMLSDSDEDGLADKLSNAGSLLENALAQDRAAPAPVVPEGWRLVPVDPTDEMKRAICREGGGCTLGREWLEGENEPHSQLDSDFAARIHAAMLAAAPQPAAQEVQP